MAKSRTRGFTRGARNTGTTASAATTIAAPEADAPKKKRVNPVQFAKEVRAEARKITWTSRKETWITSMMVFIMVAMATVFFAVVDVGLGTAVKYLIKLGS
ncbi:MAG: preprotein translocase subunit SecE [Caulobacteraceae bacterium]|nr:preprotein translocase subunit SecE [Caulobacteraceae bacterium]